MDNRSRGKETVVLEVRTVVTLGGGGRSKSSVVTGQGYKEFPVLKDILLFDLGVDYMDVNFIFNFVKIH